MRLELDTDDHVKCQQYRWYFADQTGYWMTGEITMHEFLMGKAPPGYEWDHIDGDKCNNKRNNLRLATHSQNMANKPKYEGQYASEFKGVYRKSSRRKWYAAIRVNNKKIHLGTFSIEED